MRELWADNVGQDIAEYALLMAVLLVMTVAVIQAIGINAQHVFSRLAQVLGSVM